jgi:hypothetical protein
MLGGAATASAAPTSDGPQFGFELTDESLNGQCVGPFEQWADLGTWTQAVRIDTDNRPGGCQVRFGVNDPFGDLAGLRLAYKWEVSAGGDGGQCVSQSGSSYVNIPVVPFDVFFARTFRMDTDSRSGWCNLTFRIIGRADVALDILFEYDGEHAQCVGSTDPGLNQFRTVDSTHEQTIGIDTDGRAGGCQLSFRLRLT